MTFGMPAVGFELPSFLTAIPRVAVLDLLSKQKHV